MYVIKVPSTDGESTYTIRRISENVWSCDCQDSVHRSNGKQYTCRHIAELVASLFAHAKESNYSEKAREIFELAAG